MLLPTTLSFVWLTPSPERPVKRVLVSAIRQSLGWGGTKNEKRIRSFDGLYAIFVFRFPARFLPSGAHPLHPWAGFRYTGGVSAPPPSGLSNCYAAGGAVAAPAVIVPVAAGVAPAIEVTRPSWSLWPLSSS